MRASSLNQVIVAAALTDEANDLHQLEAMLQAPGHHTRRRGHRRPAQGGAGGLRLLIDRQPHRDPERPGAVDPAGQHGRQGKPRKDGKPSASKSDGLRAAMQAKLASDDGKARYAKRRETVEPVFGQIKEHQRARRFLRRGMAACESEWKLLCGTHNLL
jgi:hypothetical protein